MPYSGDVTVGGDADVRTAGALQVTKVATPPFENNCYLLRCLETGETLLVDAAGDAPRLLELVAEGEAGGGSGLDLVVTTHQHRDHHRALAAVVAATGARTAAGAEDADALPVPVDDRLRHGDRVRVGDVVLDVVHLRGHTPGSVALAWPGPDRTHLFTGDSLFPGGVGRTRSTADFARLLRDVEERVFDRYGDSTWVYPGHGRDTTLGTERPALPQWRAHGW